MEPKKELIVHIITTLELNGAQKVCLTLFQNEQEDFNTYLITKSDENLTHKIKQSHNIYCLDSFNSDFKLTSLWQDLKAFKNLITKLKALKKKYNSAIIVHTHSQKSGILARWAAFFAGISRKVHTIHAYSFHEHQNLITWLIFYSIELITSFITTHYICVSTASAKQGIRLIPRFSKKHSIIHAGVDHSIFAKYRPALKVFPQHAPFIFGTVAGLRPGKNIIDLLKAFAACYYKNPAVRLEIIGDGPDYELITSWIEEHELFHVITLHGLQENVAPIMSKWHAFALTSLWEGGIPCVIVEARLLKLPTISYKTGGINDVIIHGKNGLVYPQKDWQGLSEGMLQLSTDQALYNTLQNSTENFNNFTYQTMIKQHRDLYRKLL